ncbi:MAG TPA: GNAT family N-acyltransferase [Bryobacteraceae bacterium]|nr:GNAT family N-acyltransferase [Bryobacteraceae bacterium]
MNPSAALTGSVFPDLLNNTPAPFRRFLHTALGLSELDKLYAQARACSSGESLSRSTLGLLHVTLNIEPRDIARVPSSGPIVLVSNHPFGLLDGLIVDALFAPIRQDLRIIANTLLSRIDEFRDRFIPLDVLSGKSAVPSNARALRTAMGWLRQGKALSMFPAGEVSHWNRSDFRAADPVWSSLPVRLAAMANATVIPVFLDGANSLAFQLAGYVHPRLRTARLPHELLNKRGWTIDVRIGTPIKASYLAALSTPDATAYVRGRTYLLSHRSGNEAQPRSSIWIPFQRQPKLEAVAPETEGFREEIAALQADGRTVLDTNDYALIAERGNQIPALLKEIGRLREITFRAVGEGTGKPRDMDSFDSYYTHLILWDKIKQRIAGSYRLVWTEDVLPKAGLGALYTSSLFHYKAAFFERLGPAVELGRSFIAIDYQREFSPLMLLWQGIGRCVAARPNAPILFGAVSISSEYSRTSREMMVEFLKREHFRPDLAHLVRPRKPFRPRLVHEPEIRNLVAMVNDVDNLAIPVQELEDGQNIPILLRQYLKLGGRVAAFNVDRRFSNVLDGLILVDLRQTPQRTLNRYMGTDQATSFLKSFSVRDPGR